jgi:hypothetical protein
MSTAGRIVVAGSIAQKPGQAGHAWQFLQYLLGLRRLGWDVLFLDDLGPGLDPAAHVGWVEQVMHEAGLDGAWSVGLGEGRHAGVRRERVLEHLRTSELLLNVMGFLTDEELLGAAPRRVFLDTDPGFPQMWRALELADVFAGHEAHVTIGERIGMEDCTVPTCGLDWITTPQPVVLEAWPVAAPAPRDSAFTSIARWRGAYGPIDFERRRYGLRVHEFRRFASVPRLTGDRFELALDIHPDETADLEMLGREGWILTDPATLAASPTEYRRALAASAGEFMVAKGMYVQSRSGWLSERSLCYLASGRPVIAQDTGFAELYPAGRGLVAYATVEEAVAAVHDVRADPEGHARAARELAEAHFDSDLVLGRLLDRLAAVVR